MPSLAPAEGGHEQHLSSRPLELSIGLAVFLTGAALYSVYPEMTWLAAMVAGVLVTAYALLGWARDDMHDRFQVEDEGEGDRWPFSSVPKMKLGVWTFLSSEVIFFGSLIGAYIFLRAAVAGWPAASSIHDIPLGTLNTVILVSSGFTMAMAVASIKRGDQRKLMTWLGATFVLGSIFMGIKLSEWQNLTSSGFVIWSSNPTTSLAASAYYFIVGLHGAHVTVGLLVMVYLMKKTMSGAYTKEGHEAIENFGLYWAFVDAGRGGGLSLLYLAPFR